MLQARLWIRVRMTPLITVSSERNGAASALEPICPQALTNGILVRRHADTSVPAAAPPHKFNTTLRACVESLTPELLSSIDEFHGLPSLHSCFLEHLLRSIFG